MIAKMVTFFAGIKQRAGVVALTTLATFACALGLVYLGWYFGTQSVQADWDAEKTVQAAVLRDV